MSIFDKLFGKNKELKAADGEKLPFRLEQLVRDDNAPLSGNYAMWWSVEEAETELFHSSGTQQTLSKIYELMKGYESYYTGYILQQLKLSTTTEWQRIALPKTFMNCAFRTPENQYVIIDLSQEKGIRYLFSTERCSVEYRNRFLKGVYEELKLTKLVLDMQNITEDETIEPYSYDWFKFMSSQVEMMEKEGKGVQLLGGMKL